MVYQQQHQEHEVLIAEPNRSASWQANKWALVAMCMLSGTIASGFAFVGAWPILPFAGLEMAALGTALYYVCWKLRYRHVVTFDEQEVRIQKGHYHPRQSWSFERRNTRIIISTKPHPWDAPGISLSHRGETVCLGEFLSKDDAQQLIELLRSRLRVQSHSANTSKDF
ncbi:DUF2244 domain-containing protein [Halieaceae bacterium IMCC14734]|uniref:DUF2244 domain-containing protein n=1 Tax=Candidatus Litorirhabdus singularis TaxID=2518993 RepID=A0ABT3TDZ3_9GAMM|nr:DUF2244 domain-containing protein [Candidatus Litorirhabdus singularis]MCX2980493.1 DUF2244 domain-containing protein [Candidatus Litorirhabdus singularis]